MPRRDVPWPRGMEGRLCYGGDYNPEQWPESVWDEDIALMGEAGVNLVSLGVFAWSRLEPREGEYEFGWLDRVMDGLAEHGIRADLATATASPPPWFSHAHPGSLPVDRDGRRLWYGSRQSFCPSSPEYRDAAAGLVERLATRYGDHPALALWHVNNEYGCHIRRCWCDTSAEAFRTWLQRRYGDIDALNEAWGAAFWSQRYSAWEQILPPRGTPSFPNPTQQLDFYRFSSDELIVCFRAERDLLHRITPGVPVTTNFLIAEWGVDYWAFAAEVDVVSMDHYLVAERADPHADLALIADLARSLAGGRPWILMEHATSAVNWQPRNLARPAGRMRRDSLAHVARGADAVLYFQWRQSRAGAEKWHSGMVPHAGTETKVWREVVALGGELADLAEVAGSRVVADAAILLDWANKWAQDHECQPSVDMDPVAFTEQWHAALRAAAITCDFAHPSADLDAYRLVLVPALYLVSDAGAENLAAYVARGGTAVVGPFSGVVDEHDHVRLGGYPGAWRDLLGVRVQEHFPLAAGETVTLSDGSQGRAWTELATVTDAQTLLTYADGPLCGGPALTRRVHGAGVVHYLTTQPTADGLRALLARLAAGAGVQAEVTVPGVEAVTRRHPDGRSYTFLANDGAEPLDVPVDGELLGEATGVATPGGVQLPPGGLAILRRA